MQKVVLGTSYTLSYLVIPPYLREKQSYHILIGRNKVHIVSLNIDVKMKQDFNNINIRINHIFISVTLKLRYFHDVK